MLNENVVVCNISAESADQPPEQESTHIPIVAMEEITPGRFWVLVNFPGRTSLSLATDADRDLAEELMGCARRVAVESLAYTKQTLDQARVNA